MYAAMLHSYVCDKFMIPWVANSSSAIYNAFNGF